MTLRFETEPPVEAPSPNRMDVACFVGFVRPRPGAASIAVQRWLTEQGWLQTPGGVRMPFARAWQGVCSLAAAPYVARDTLFLPLPWLADCLPRTLAPR